jgi:hypothetical protein
MRRSRRAKLTHAVGALGVAIGAFVAASCTATPSPRASSLQGKVRVHSVAAVTRPTAITLPSDLTLVATTNGAIPGSAAPGAAPDTTVPASWYGYPSVLPVIASAPNWVEVRLAQRPNGSTTWVPLSDVTLSSTPYHLVLNLSTEHLTVYEYGHQILDFPAGVGTPTDPTVTGNYFITMTVPPPDPGYGPFVLVTSAHSDSISDWGDSGDAITAIHGPITPYDDSLIGTTGAAISHGSIRLHDADLSQLAGIPAGTPLDMVASSA